MRCVSRPLLPDGPSVVLTNARIERGLSHARRAASWGVQLVRPIFSKYCWW